MNFKGNAALAGIGLMSFACFCSAANGALAKGLMVGFPIAMVLLFRTATAWSLVLCLTPTAEFRGLPHPWLQLLRMVLCAVEVPMYFFSLTTLPIVDTMTYYLATPIYATAISATLLGEHVGWRRWSAILFGFAGVLIALRPSTAMLTWPALIALTGSILYAGILTTTRVLRGTPDRILLLGQQTGILILSGVVASQNWVPVSASDIAMMAVLGALALIGSFCTNRSLKLAPASVVVPYQYTLLPWGGLFGFLFFAETPQVTTLIGAAFIIAAGLYIFMREQRMARPAVPANEPA